MFQDLKPPRAKPRVLMHVCDAGFCDEDLDRPELCRMKCTRCGVESDWLSFANVTEAKRGVPCEVCNAKSAPAIEPVEDIQAAEEGK